MFYLSDFFCVMLQCLQSLSSSLAKHKIVLTDTRMESVLDIITDDTDFFFLLIRGTDEDFHFHFVCVNVDLCAEGEF